MIRLIWIKEVKGRENLPKSGAYIIAANHQSYLDFLCIQAVMPARLTFLAAERFFDSRLCGPILKRLGHIRVDRSAKDKSETIEEVITALNIGRTVAIFPQGGLSRNGKIEKTRTGVARFALMTGAKVVPVGIRGTYEVFPPGAKRPKLKKMVEINIGAPMNLSEYRGRQDNPAAYREATDEVMDKIAGLAGLERAPKLF